MIYVSSDHHFSHRNIVSYCKRGYASAHEMNEDLIFRWNAKVKNSDIVYYLGDFGLAPKEVLKDILARLNRKKIILIKGNHDKSDKANLEIGFDEVHKYLDLKYQGRDLFMSHIPFSCREFDVMLCGHVHDKFHINGNIFNVGVDVNDYAPISLEEVFVKYWQNLDPKQFLPMELNIQGEQ